MRGLFHLVDCA